MNFNIEAIKRKMLVKYPFFGSVVANINYKEDREILTAGTDGQTIYYNPEFLRKYKTDEQTFIFAHEVCHIAFDHIKRSEGKDPEIWNLATDGVINQFLKRDGLKLIDGCVDIVEAINYDAEQLYDKLLKEKQQSQSPLEDLTSQNESKSQGQNSGAKNEEQSPKQTNSQQDQRSTSSSKQGEQSQGQGSSEESQKENENQSQGQNSETQEASKQEQSNSKQDQQGTSSSKKEEQSHDVGHDTHKMWKDAVKRQKEVESKASQFNDEETQQEEKLQQGIDKIKEMGERSAFNKNLEEKRKELEALKQLLSQQAMGAGATTNRDQRIINDIGNSKPIIDWRYVLREAIQYDVDWSYKNAYIEDGVVSANLEEQPMPETEILLDTSGSIDDLLLKNFLRECKNILQHSKIKVGCFDTEFYGFQEIRTEEDIENMQFEGGGGTDFNVAVRAFTRRVENKIIFTDGDAPMPDIPMDAIWIVFGGIKINPKGGKVIQINEEQLKRLYSFKQDISYEGKSR